MAAAPQMRAAMDARVAAMGQTAEARRAEVLALEAERGQLEGALRARAAEVGP